MYSHPLFRYAKIGRRSAQEVAEKVSLALDSSACRRLSTQAHRPALPGYQISPLLVRSFQIIRPADR